MARRIGPFLCVVGTLCLAAGLMPGGWGTSHPLADGSTGGSFVGLPFSPLFKSYRTTIESPRSFTVDEDGRSVESSYVSSTVCRWTIRVFSWSALLVGLGLVLLGGPLRAAWKDGAAERRARDGGA